MRNLSQISLSNYFTSVEPKLTERESWVYEAIEELAPCTAEMVAEHYGVGVNVVSGRFTGLKKKRKIIKAFEGRNNLGNKVAYYQPKDMAREYDDTY
jgi:RNA binding exosome subunit